MADTKDEEIQNQTKTLSKDAEEESKPKENTTWVGLRKSGIYVKPTSLNIPPKSAS